MAGIQTLVILLENNIFNVGSKINTSVRDFEKCYM